MLALKYLARFIRDLAAYTWVNEVWWPFPLIILLFSIGILALTTQAVTPYLYTLF